MSAPEVQSGFSISKVPPTLESALILNEIESAAHEDSPIGPLLYPYEPENPAEKNPAELEEEGEYTLSFLKKLENQYFMVTEEATGKDVAFVWWQHQKGITPEEWAETYKNRYRTERMNIPLMDATSGARFLKRAKILGDQDVFSKLELRL
jgi:hypothetical protein